MNLFSPLKCGSLTLPNRIIMAPLTRARTPSTVPGKLQELYYQQRASAGLIITEATNISPTGTGYVYTPGIYSDEQEAGWKGVCEAIHAAGGRIAMQLWHVGRVSHELVQPNGAQPVAPSAIRGEGAQAFVEFEDGTAGRTPASTPRALEVSEIADIVADYRKAAIRAVRAGCDLVELHAANAYLLHQFMATGTNLRSDQYGGSVVNRARIVLEVVDAIGKAVGYDRIGIRIAPFSEIFGLTDEESGEMALYLADQLSGRKIAYLHINEPDWQGKDIHLTPEFRKSMRDAFDGTLLYCGHYDAARAQALIADQLADAVAFGRPFIANPDLPERIRVSAPLNDSNPETYYGEGSLGYTDYPALTRV